VSSSGAASAADGSLAEGSTPSGCAAASCGHSRERRTSRIAPTTSTPATAASSQ
jgi:hypothetical protein